MSASFTPFVLTFDNKNNGDDMSNASEAPTPDDGLNLTDNENTGPVLAADGTPLKRSLGRALRRQKLRALMLIAPLLIFVLLTFIAPIADMLFRSVENQIVSETLPRTVVALDDWDSTTGELPSEAVYEAAYYDIFIAAERKLHTRLGSRLNYELTGASSLFRKSGRGLDDLGEVYQDQFEDLNEAWEDGETWALLMGSGDWQDKAYAWEKSSGDLAPKLELREGIEELLPKTAAAYSSFANFVRVDDGDNPATEDPWSLVYTAFWQDLTGGANVASYSGPEAELLMEAANARVGSSPRHFPKGSQISTKIGQARQSGRRSRPTRPNILPVIFSTPLICKRPRTGQNCATRMSGSMASCSNARCSCRWSSRSAASCWAIRSPGSWRTCLRAPPTC